MVPVVAPVMLAGCGSLTWDGSPGLDGNGGTGGASGQAGGEPDPASVVFAQGQILEYRVTIDPADQAYLDEHGNDEEYVPAFLRVTGGNVGERDLGQVGIRYKGAYSLHHCWDDFGGIRSYEDECAKLSYKLKFDEYVEDTRFEGLKRLNLHASSGDESKLREMLGYRLFNDFGVDAPLAAPAQVYVNEELVGLFIAVEAIDGRYTHFHYPEGGDGNLYKEVWPRAGLVDQYFIQGLETNDDAPNIADIQSLAEAIEATDEARFETDLAAFIDLETLLRYVAVDRALKNWDGIMTFYSPESPHNYYWYHDDGSDGRFHLIPWDLDNVLWSFDPYMDPQQWVTAEPVPDFNVLPASCDPIPVWEPTGDTRVTPPGCDKLLRLLASTQWNRFVQIGQDLIDGPLRYQILRDQTADWAALIEPAVADDPYLDLDDWQSERDELLTVILPQVSADFADFLAEGYGVQQPEVPLAEPTAAELDAPGPERGLVVGAVNNYEFEGAAAGSVPEGVFSYGADGVTDSPSYNTVNPLSGNADLRFDFEFTRIPGEWNEWVDVGIATDGSREIDITSYSQISITVVADRSRNLRIRVSSPAYDDVFGGAWTEFGGDYAVSTTPTTVRMRLDRLYYPDWAKEAWTDGQGWTTSDDEALQVLLSRFDGLRFAPGATTDSSGELLEERETGYLQIDNIYFQRPADEMP